MGEHNTPKSEENPALNQGHDAVHGHVHGPHCNHGPAVLPFVRAQPKVGRNDPCPCQSGHKYKKCCGKAV